MARLDTALRAQPQASAVQVLLNAVAKPGEGNLQEDGVFGKKTDTALRDFEHKVGLSVDGIASLRVWRELLARTS